MPSSRRKTPWVKGVLSTVAFAAASVLPSGCNQEKPLRYVQCPDAPLKETATLKEDVQYRSITLSNCLEVMLIQDPDADSSAAALAVGAGSLYNPENKQGLAHYLEHMLFLGTEKYPETGAYFKFLSANGGGANAYTADDHTNYFLQVSDHAYEEALDRLSDFFKTPQFYEKYAEKEVNAVNEEFLKNKQKDNWRLFHLISSVAGDGHPLTRFSTGNSETLSGDNQEALLDFFDRYYAAGNMRLAMISSIPLDKQEALARTYFEGIPDFEVKHPYIDPGYQPPLRKAYRLLEVEPVRDIRNMSINFPTASLQDYDASKPANIISALIGHEGEGSLLSKLKEEGLATGLSAGGSAKHENINAMTINIALTKKGLEEKERILELLFSYIEMLKEEGIAKYTFDEEQAMSRINYDWRDNPEGGRYASGIAATMLKYDLDEVHSAPHLIRKYNKDAYEAVIGSMRPENMLVAVQAKGVETDSVSEHYGAEYSLKEVGGQTFARLKNPPKAEDVGLSYPEKNPYIPYNLTLLEPDTKASKDNKPQVIIDNEIAKIWFQFDTEFQKPRTYLTLSIETPEIYKTPENYMRAHLLNMCAREGMNEDTYPFNLAGLEHKVSIGPKGATVSIGGYNEHINDFIEFVSGNLTACHIDDESFNNLKEALVRNLENQELAPAYQIARSLPLSLFYNVHANEELLEAAKKITKSDVQDYAKQLFERVKIRGVAYGNWRYDDVKSAVDLFVDTLGSKPLPDNERPVFEPVEELSEREKAVFSTKVKDNNNALLYMFNVGDRDLEKTARLNLIGGIVRSAAFAELRTNQQLGYLVSAYPNQVDDKLFLNVVIQSRYGPAHLQQAVDDWRKTTATIIDSMSDEAFEKLIESQVEKYQEKLDNINEAQKALFRALVEDETALDTPQKLADITQTLTKEDIRDFVEQILVSEDNARLAIHVRSGNNDNEPPEGAHTTIESFKDRDEDREDKKTPDTAAPPRPSFNGH